MDFKVGDYAVCAGHGVGQICDIETRDVGGGAKSFYIIKTISNGMKVMVPTDSQGTIRPLVSHEQAKDVYEILRDHNVAIDNSTWNRRYREYMNKINTGSLTEIAEVLRALFLLKAEKNLSFGEKAMLNKCRDLLSQEISLSSGKKESEIGVQIDSCFQEESTTASS